MRYYQPNHAKNVAAIGIIVVRAAKENIPVKVIARILGHPEQKLKRYLDSARDKGEIADIPPDDWPNLGGISQSLPSSEMMYYGHHDVDVADTCHEFGLTVGEGCLLMCLVKRAGQFCSKEVLLSATARKTDDVVGNLVQTKICHLRKKLKPIGVGIVMKRWCGYMMPVSCAQVIISRIATRRSKIRSMQP